MTEATDDDGDMAAAVTTMEATTIESTVANKDDNDSDTMAAATMTEATDDDGDMAAAATTTEAMTTASL